MYINNKFVPFDTSSAVVIPFQFMYINNAGENSEMALML